MHLVRILICDRDIATVEAIRAYAEALGHDVASAQDAETAAREIVEFWPEMVVLDLTSIGLDVVRAIRAEPWPLEIAVIVLTRGSEVGEIAEIYHAGADMAISKPFHPRELGLRGSRD